MLMLGFDPPNLVEFDIQDRLRKEPSIVPLMNLYFLKYLEWIQI